MDEAKLQQLLDRMEITDVSNRYASGVDLKERELYRSCFTDEISVDFSSIGMGEPMELSADNWVEQVMTFMEMYESTQHIITNHSIVIDGDELDVSAVTLEYGPYLLYLSDDILVVELQFCCLFTHYILLILSGYFIWDITRATMVMSLIRMFSDGPLVSLNGSPTVSPITAAA